MGNDAHFVNVEDLPFRLIEIPMGSAPPPPSPPIRKSHTLNKCHAPPIPPRRFDGYDAPPSLLPPPIAPKRFDRPEPPVSRPVVPPRSDVSSTPKQTIHVQKSSRKIVYNTKNFTKRKATCCTIS